MGQNPDVNFIGVTNLESGDDRARDKFISNMRVQIPHVLDEPFEIWTDFGVHSQPSMVFVKADGTWERHTGHIEPPDLLDRANALVADL
jgi:hypothetical protein